MNAAVNKSGWGRWFIVVVFSIAMAWVESAVVYYLRTHLDRIEPHQANPLPLIGSFGPVELVRELATLIMLLSVGLLAGRTGRERFAFALIAFGVWDIFYYAFLKVMCGWPSSLLDWDILFLIPLPWWGPVLAPMLIAALMIGWGTLATQLGRRPPTSRSRTGAWWLSVVGAGLALYTFMADALRVVDRGVTAVREVLPDHFNWVLFAVALALMASPVIQLLTDLRQGSGARREPPEGFDPVNCP